MSRSPARIRLCAYSVLLVSKSRNNIKVLSTSTRTPRHRLSTGLISHEKGCAGVRHGTREAETSVSSAGSSQGLATCLATCEALRGALSALARARDANAHACGPRALWLSAACCGLCSVLSHEAAEDAHLPPVHAEQRARLHPCRLQPGRVQFALLSHREELAAHEITADRRGGAPGS